MIVDDIANATVVTVNDTSQWKNDTTGYVTNAGNTKTGSGSISTTVTMADARPVNTITMIGVSIVQSGGGGATASSDDSNNWFMFF